MGGAKDSFKYVGVKGKSQSRQEEAGPRRARFNPALQPDARVVEIDDEDLDTKPFNVCFIRVPQIKFPRFILWEETMDLFQETADLLRPVLRLGIPQTSLKNKCKWWREDNEPLPTTPGVRLRNMLKTLEKEEEARKAAKKVAKKAAEAAAEAERKKGGGPWWAVQLQPQQQQQQQQQKLEFGVVDGAAVESKIAQNTVRGSSKLPEGGLIRTSPGGHGAHGSRRIHVPHTSFIMQDFTAPMVLGLNVACWMFVTTPCKRKKGGGW